MHSNTLLRNLTLLLLAGTLAFGGLNCGLFGIGEEKDDDTANLLTLFGLWAIANSASSCEDNSGLVICIPPGVRR